jgi:beta-lactamase superfamily II metal-dependent hydrolase
MIKRIALLATTIIMACTSAMAAKHSDTRTTFTLWQLPSIVDDHGNSYVIRTVNDSIIVIDGGKVPETDYLRGFLGALGNRVCAWIITHPHIDHMGAAAKILHDRKGLSVGCIYHSRFTEEMLAGRKERDQADYWNATVDSLPDIPVVDIHTADSLIIDGVRFRFLSEKNPEIKNNLYNNSSVAMRVDDATKSIVFLADLGIEGGNKLLASDMRKYLDCDYLQMAHHGQDGCSEQFYKSIKFRACLWPTATWVWNNDFGGGFNTGHLKTIETRRWMDEIGITEHYNSIDGLQRIE